MEKRYINKLINLSLLLGGLIFCLVLAELFFRLFPAYGLRYNFSQFAIENNPTNRAMMR